MARRNNNKKINAYGLTYIKRQIKQERAVTKPSYSGDPGALGPLKKLVKENPDFPFFDNIKSVEEAMLLQKAGADINKLDASGFGALARVKTLAQAEILICLGAKTEGGAWFNLVLLCGGDKDMAKQIKAKCKERRFTEYAGHLQRAGVLKYNNR